MDASKEFFSELTRRYAAAETERATLRSALRFAQEDLAREKARAERLMQEVLQLTQTASTLRLEQQLGIELEERPDDEEQRALDERDRSDDLRCAAAEQAYEFNKENA